MQRLHWSGNKNCQTQFDRISIRGGLSLWHQVVLVGLAFGMATVIVWLKVSGRNYMVLPSIFVLGGIIMFSHTFAHVLFKIANYPRGFAHLSKALLPDANCPKITAIIALRGEERVISQLLGTLSVLDYPVTKLQIILAVDRDDAATLSTLDRCPLPKRIARVIGTMVVPNNAPGPIGKPRSIQYVLNQGVASGEIMVYFDAEDRIHPLQMRAAATALAQYPEVDFIQAKLVIDPRMPKLPRTKGLKAINWIKSLAVALVGYALTLPTAIGYAVINEISNPGLIATNGQYRLFGTSYYGRRSAQLGEGGLDIWNVTEDFDKAVRSRRAGRRILMLPDYPTVEETTHTLPAQIKQRSRWIKGHPATFVAHTRNPWRLVRDLGWRGTSSFICETFCPLPESVLAPIYWFLTLWYALFHSVIVQQVTPAPAFYLGEICLLGNLFYLWQAILACLEAKRHQLWWALPLLPLHWWVVGTWSGVLALSEIIRGRWSLWRKTEHARHLTSLEQVGARQEKTFMPAGVQRQPAGGD